MFKYTIALAALFMAVVPAAASAATYYGYRPAYQPAAYYPSDPNYSMAAVQNWGYMMSLRDTRYSLATDCTNYGYGDCRERMAWSGNPYGPGYLITGPMYNYGGGYNAAQYYQPTNYYQQQPTYGYNGYSNPNYGSYYGGYQQPNYGYGYGSYYR